MHIIDQSSKEIFNFDHHEKKDIHKGFGFQSAIFMLIIYLILSDLMIDNQFLIQSI